MKIVKITTEYITLGQFLKFMGIIRNGSEAKPFLFANDVLVNGEKDRRRGRKLYDDYEVLILNQKYKVKI